VLVAVACDQIVMAEDARIGNASQFEPDPNFIEPSMRNAYVEIANRRKTIPADLALKMLDPSLEVLEVETEVSREYVLSSRLKDLEKKKTVAKKKVRFPAGEPGGDGRHTSAPSRIRQTDATRT
jgi:membrane-bound ClpP family serine protease